MSEETTMYEELEVWARFIRKLQSLAAEMESPEQDGDYMTQSIRKLFAKFEAMQAEGDDVADCYYVDFEHPDNPNYKLALEINLFFVETEP